MLDRRHHTVEVQMFAGTKAVRTHACTAVLDTGSPASFIQEKLWNRMPAFDAASLDGNKRSGPKKWGGFHRVPLVSTARVHLNVHILKGRRKAAGIPGSRQPVCKPTLTLFPTSPCRTLIYWDATFGHISLNAHTGTLATTNHSYLCRAFRQ